MPEEYHVAIDDRGSIEILRVLAFDIAGAISIAMQKFCKRFESNTGNPIKAWRS